jgi:hypothetical protein
VTRRSHRVQKHKFGVWSLGVLFMDFVQVPPEQENGTPTFHGPDTPECTS